MIRATLSGAERSRHWKIALCSESTGNSRAPDARAASIISVPAETSASLLAKATVLPRSSAAITGRNPAQPTIAAMIQSASSAATALTASSPAETSIPDPASISCNAANFAGSAITA